MSCGNVKQGKDFASQSQYLSMVVPSHFWKNKTLLETIDEENILVSLRQASILKGAATTKEYILALQRCPVPRYRIVAVLKNLSRFFKY